MLLAHVLAAVLSAFCCTVGKRPCTLSPAAPGRGCSRSSPRRCPSCACASATGGGSGASSRPRVGRARSSFAARGGCAGHLARLLRLTPAIIAPHRCATGEGHAHAVFAQWIPRARHRPVDHTSRAADRPATGPRGVGAVSVLPRVGSDRDVPQRPVIEGTRFDHALDPFVPDCSGARLDQPCRPGRARSDVAVLRRAEALVLERRARDRGPRLPDPAHRLGRHVRRRSAVPRARPRPSGHRRHRYPARPPRSPPRCCSSTSAGSSRSARAASPSTAAVAASRAKRKPGTPATPSTSCAISATSSRPPG